MGAPSPESPSGLFFIVYKKVLIDNQSIL